MDDLTAWDREVRTSTDVPRLVNLDLSIRRLMPRIDRALDLRNRRAFMELTSLLRQYKAQC